jgi:hypothetical protein
MRHTSGEDLQSGDMPTEESPMEDLPIQISSDEALLLSGLQSGSCLVNPGDCSGCGQLQVSAYRTAKDHSGAADSGETMHTDRSVPIHGVDDGDD